MTHELEAPYLIEICVEGCIKATWPVVPPLPANLLLPCCAPGQTEVLCTLALSIEIAAVGIAACPAAHTFSIIDMKAPLSRLQLATMLSTSVAVMAKSLYGMRMVNSLAFKVRIGC